MQTDRGTKSMKKWVPICMGCAFFAGELALSSLGAAATQQTARFFADDATNLVPVSSWVRRLDKAVQTECEPEEEDSFLEDSDTELSTLDWVVGTVQEMVNPIPFVFKGKRLLDFLDVRTVPGKQIVYVRLKSPALDFVEQGMHGQKSLLKFFCSEGDDGVVEEWVKKSPLYFILENVKKCFEKEMNDVKIALVIPEGVQYIGNYAFAGCNISAISFPKSIVSIGGGAFERCENLIDVFFPVTGTEFMSGIEAIGPYAFDNCRNLQRIILPQSLTFMGDGAFRECSNLKKINIPSKVTAIKNYSFEGCTSLEKIDIQGDISDIGACAFIFCTRLKNIDFPKKVTTVQWGTFSGCSSLKEIDLSQSSIQHIENEAFLECTNLEDIQFPSSLLSIDEMSFSNCLSLRNINIPKSVTDLSDSAFSTCTSLRTITVESPGTFCLGYSSFENNPSLEIFSESVVCENFVNRFKNPWQPVGEHLISMPELQFLEFSDEHFSEKDHCSNDLTIVTLFVPALCPIIKNEKVHSRLYKSVYNQTDPV